MDTKAAQSRRSFFLAVGEPLRPSQFAPSRVTRNDSLRMSPTSLSLSPSASPASIFPSVNSTLESPEFQGLDGPPIERMSTLKNPVIHRPSVLQITQQPNRRGSEMFQARRSIRSTTTRMPSIKPKSVEPESAAMHTPNLFKEYKYKKTNVRDSLVKVGPNNEEREIKRLSIFSAFGSRVTDTRPMSPANSRKSRAFAKRQTLIVPKQPSPKDGGVTPTYKHSERAHAHAHAYDSNFMTITGSDSSDNEEFLTPEQLRLRKIFKKALYATYFVGVMISFKNKVKVYGALRPIEYLEEFESIQPKSKHKRILPLKPSGTFSMIWAITIIFCLTLTAVLTPIYISFVDNDNQFFYYLNLVMDISFGIDIVINFLSAYFDVEGELVTDFRKIIWNYFKMWFWIDIIAVVPLDEILQSDVVNLGSLKSSHQIFRLLRFPRLYKLFKIIRLLKVTKIFSSNRGFNRIRKKLSLNVRVTKIAQIFLNFAFVNHLVGCLWFFVARFDDFNPETWVGRSNLQDKDTMTQYLASLYWSFQTLTTVGYGDMAPQTPLERTFGSIWIMIGVLIYTFTVGNLSALLFGFRMKAESLDEKLLSFERFAVMANIPDFLVQKVRRFYEINHKENTCHWIDPADQLKSLPANLRTSLLLYSYYAFIKDIKVLQINANLTSALLVHFKVLKLKAGEIIYRQDDPSHEIYFIAKGTVKFVTQKRKGIFSLSQGTYFGELEAFEGTKRLCFCKALNSTVLIICPTKDFLKILQDFPDIESQMKRISLSRKGKLEEKVARLTKIELQDKESRKSLSAVNPTPLANMTEYINKILLKLPDPEVRYQKRRRERKLERPKSIAIIDGSSLTNIPTSPEKRPRKKKRTLSITPRGNMMSMEDIESLGQLGESESIVFSSNTLKVPTKSDLEKMKKKQSLLKKKTSIKKEAVGTLAKINDVTSPSLPSVVKPGLGESVDNLLSMETKAKDPSSLAKMDKFDTLMDQIDVGTASFSTTPNNKDFRTRMEKDEKPSAKQPVKLKKTTSKTSKTSLPQITVTDGSKANVEAPEPKKSFFFGGNLFSLVKSQGLKGLLRPAPKVVPTPIPQTEVTSPISKTYQRFLMSGESDYEK